jgi:hypothetical protein
MPKPDKPPKRKTAAAQRVMPPRQKGNPAELMDIIQGFLREKGYEVGSAPLRFGTTQNPNAAAESGDEIVFNERDQGKLQSLSDIYSNQGIRAGANRLQQRGGLYSPTEGGSLGRRQLEAGGPAGDLPDHLRRMVHESIHQHKGSPYKRHQEGDYPDQEGVDSFLEEASTESAARDITPALMKRLFGEARPGTMANVIYNQRGAFGPSPANRNAMPGDAGTGVGADVPRDPEGQPMIPAMTDITNSPYAQGVGAMRLRSARATGQGAQSPASRHWRRNLANAQGPERPLMLAAADANRPNQTNRTPMSLQNQLKRVQPNPSAPAAMSSAGSGLTPPRKRRLRPAQGRPT